MRRTNPSRLVYTDAGEAFVKYVAAGHYTVHDGERLGTVRKHGSRWYASLLFASGYEAIVSEHYPTRNEAVARILRSKADATVDIGEFASARATLARATGETP